MVLYLVDGRILQVRGVSILQRVLRLFHTRLRKRGRSGARGGALLLLIDFIIEYFGWFIRVFTYHSGVERSLKLELGKADLFPVDFHLKTCLDGLV